MIETFKDLKHGKSSYETQTLERTASQILHQLEIRDGEDSLEVTRARVLANARAIYGATRSLDIISYAPTSSRKIGAAIVEHNPTGRSYIHCSSAKEDSRLAAFEHLLVITEDILQRLLDSENISSCGWLPATAQSQHAATFHAASAANAATGSSGSIAGSRHGSVQPPEPHLLEHQQQQLQHQIPVQLSSLIRNNSDLSHVSAQPLQNIPRTNSEGIMQPRPMPLAQLQRQGRVQWNLGSEE